MTKKTNINLTHGEINLKLEVEGIEPSKYEREMRGLFELFLKETLGTVSVEKPASNEQSRFREAFKSLKYESEVEPVVKVQKREITPIKREGDKPLSNLIQLTKQDQYKPIVEAVHKVEEVVVEVQDEKATSNNRHMEELLKDVDPRSYKLVNGVYKFQLYYICEKCGDKNKMFVERKPTFTCRECGKRMILTPASSKPFPFMDSFGNFYVGGKHQRQEDRVTASKEETVYQFKLEQEMVEAREEDRPQKLKVR